MGEMGEDAKPEDVLKVMEAVGGLALKMRLEDDDEVGPFGLDKNPKKNPIHKLDGPSNVINLIKKFFAPMVKDESSAFILQNKSLN